MIPADQLTPEIQSAYELVRANPGDPNAHLQLSLAFWDAELDLPANEEYGQATHLAGPNNEGFYLSAAQEYKVREAWHLAAGMYLNLFPSYTSQNRAIPEDVKDDFRESAYKGAQRSDLPLVMPFEQVTGFQMDFANIVRGRHALYNGDLPKADELLMLANRPNGIVLPEVHLLKAEIAIEKGNTGEAQKILRTLAVDPNVQEWVRTMAEEILKSIQ